MGNEITKRVQDGQSSSSEKKDKDGGCQHKHKKTGEAGAGCGAGTDKHQHSQNGTANTKTNGTTTHHHTTGTANDSQQEQHQQQQQQQKHQQRTPIHLESSRELFHEDDSKKKKSHHTSIRELRMAKVRASTNDGVMITDHVTDVSEKYHINPKELGHGHYGVVRKCMDRKTHEWFAIKSIRKSKVGKVDVLKREIAILREVDHPNIIKLIEVHEDAKYLHLVTELCTGGELFDRIIAKTQSAEGHFSERDAARLITCILDAIAYCHDVKQIVHRDLKPENFLFLNSSEGAPIKIIDFGLSRHDTQNLGVMKTKVGTPYYVAPEVLRREYTKSCDIWSIGVICYILLCGYPPFYGDSDNQIFESVRTGHFDFPSPDWDDISSDAKDFIVALLKKDPAHRLTARQALSHSWIRTQAEKYSNKYNNVNLDMGSNRSHQYKKYMGMQKLKKAALAHIATHLTQAEVGTLGDIFRKIDKDGDGFMTLEELDHALSHANFSNSLQEDLMQLRKDLKLNGEDTLNWKDFLAAMMDKSMLLREDKVRMAFEHFKKADAKDLLISDLVELFGGESHAREIMRDVDTDGDGRISYEEFRDMMSGTWETNDL